MTHVTSLSDGRVRRFGGMVRQLAPGVLAGRFLRDLRNDAYIEYN